MNCKIDNVSNIWRRTKTLIRDGLIMGLIFTFIIGIAIGINWLFSLFPWPEGTGKMMGGLFLWAVIIGAVWWFMNWLLCAKKSHTQD